MLLNIRHILLVDDDEDEYLLFKDALQEIGVKAQFLYFRNGKEAISYLENTNSVSSHLIFLDLNMPLMTGKDCLRVLRQKDKFKSIPIAIYSTTSLQDDIDDTHALGANMYVKKPLDFLGIKYALDKILNINWELNLKSNNYLFLA